METLLLWVDELDDAIGAIRHLAPKILALVLAMALFVATGFVLLSAPHPILAAAAIALSASLIERVRRRLRPPTPEPK